VPTYDAEDAAVTDETAAGGTPAGGPAGPSRRSLLLAASAALPVLLTACKGVQALGTPPPPPPDIRALRAAIAAEELMVDTYGFAILRLETSPAFGQAGLLAAFHAAQTDHVAHLAQLRSRLIEPVGTPTPSPSRASAFTAGTSLTEVLTTLENAEQATSDRLIGQLAVLPPALAQLFASIAASEATHVPLLQAQAVAR
jgi:hypothetical protein